MGFNFKFRIMEVDDLQTSLYRSLCSNNDHEVIELCRHTLEGPLHYCTLHKSTVLHLACYFQKIELASKLFDTLSENRCTILIERTNALGDTVLHDASTSNSDEGVKLVKKMLQTVPDLLQARNKEGETPLFRATRYGNKKMFDLLAKEVDKFCELHTEVNPCQLLQRNDKTTILHMAILARNFDMALKIAKNYPFLCDEKAQGRLTALQLLACSPAAFESGARFGLVKKVLYKSVSTDTEEAGLIKKALKFITSIGKICCTIPMIEDVINMKKGHKDALELSKILIKSDTSWMHTHEPLAEVTPVIVADIPIFANESNEESSPRRLQSGRDVMKNGTLAKSSYHHQQENYDIETGKPVNRSEISGSDEAPLLLAARKGCVEIVKEILSTFPQAVNYLNRDKENLLHVAIKSRNMEIYKLLKKSVLPLRGLLATVDNKNNSILHMVGCPKEVHPGTKMKSPVLQLSDDLLLLERLKNKCPSYLINHRNDEMMTAEELFAKNNETLRKEAKEWLKKTSEHSTVVIILIATVAFAAAYTVPGGPDEETGYPLLLRRPFFLVFTVTDVLSLGFASTAVVVFLSIITSSYQLKDFRRSLPYKLFLGFTLLFISVTMMMVAFAATIILMVNHNHKERWTKIALYVVAFFPICVFMLSYIPVYIKLAEALKYWVKKIVKSLPRPVCIARLSSSQSSFESV